MPLPTDDRVLDADAEIDRRQRRRQHADVGLDTEQHQRAGALARDGAALEYAGKRGGKPSPKQRDISLRLVELAKAGKRVLRLKGGDPFVFGRGGEEAEVLAAENIPFEVVPGVTSGVAAIAWAGIPVTHRREAVRLTLLTAHEAIKSDGPQVRWDLLAQDPHATLVGYMGFSALPQVLALCHWTSTPVGIPRLSTIPASEPAAPVPDDGPEPVREFSRREVREAFRAVRVRIARINTYIQENVTGMKEVQLFTREERNLRDFAELNGDHRDAWLRSIRYDAALFSVVEFAGGLTVAIIIWYGTGLATAGVMYVFIQWMRRFFMPLRDLSAKYSVMQSAMASCERIFQLMDTEPKVRDPEPEPLSLK